MCMRRKWFFIAPAAVLGILLFVGIGGAIVQQLWNWLLPALFGWPHVTFWQALGLLVLCRILFGGLGRHGHRGSKMREADREAIRDRIRARWGSMGHPSDAPPKTE